MKSVLRKNKILRSIMLSTTASIDHFTCGKKKKKTLSPDLASKVFPESRAFPYCQLWEKHLDLRCFDFPYYGFQLRFSRDLSLVFSSHTHTMDSTLFSQSTIPDCLDLSENFLQIPLVVIFLSNDCGLTDREPYTKSSGSMPTSNPKEIFESICSHKNPCEIL